MKVKTTAENRKDVVKAMEEILNVSVYLMGLVRSKEGSFH